MRRLLCLLALVSLSACTGGSTQVEAGPSSHASAAGLACEIPYLTTNGSATGEYIAVGFLKLPGGTFRTDPNAVSNLPPAGVEATYSGESGRPWWDAQASRWVPARPTSTSPNGQTYYYVGKGGLHEVTVTTGIDDVVFPQPQGVHGGDLLGVQADGVYFVFPAAVKDGSGGSLSNPPDQVVVWRYDPSTGSTMRVRPSDSVGDLGGGALWIGGDSLVRVDLATGARSDWFSVQGMSVQFLGVDEGGVPLVWTFDNRGHLEIWRISDPNQATSLYSVEYTGNPPIYGPEAIQGLLTADEHGVWFGANDGLYLYDQTGFHEVSSVAGLPAGACR